MIEWTHFYFFVMVAGVLVLACGLESFSEWTKAHKRLHINIRRMDDGRFCVHFWWNVWETPHTDHVDPETLPAYLSDLALESLKEK